MNDHIALLSEAFAYIEEHLKDENLVAEDVVKGCYSSKTSLQKLFRYVSGQGVKEYIQKRRITCATKLMLSHPEESILSIAVEYGYGSHEAFTRAFEQMWHCTPSEFRKKARFSGLYPKMEFVGEKGDYNMGYKRVDVSELYDFFVERKDCYFICSDIAGLIPINDIAFKAGDLAILEAIHRMEQVASEEDVIFRIGGDEFVLLTASSNLEEAMEKAEGIRVHNGETFDYEGREIPLKLHVCVTKAEDGKVRFKDLFQGLLQAINASKQ